MHTHIASRTSRAHKLYAPDGAFLGTVIQEDKGAWFFRGLVVSKVEEKETADTQAPYSLKGLFPLAKERKDVKEYIFEEAPEYNEERARKWKPLLVRIKDKLKIYFVDTTTAKAYDEDGKELEAKIFRIKDRLFIGGDHYFADKNEETGKDIYFHSEALEKFSNCDTVLAFKIFETEKEIIYLPYVGYC